MEMVDTCTGLIFTGDLEIENVSKVALRILSCYYNA